MRRTLTLVVALVALLAIVAAGAWVVRIHLAQAWLEGTLAARGYAEARFEITAVDLERIVVEDFELRDARNTRVRRLSARYTPWALLTGSWSAVAVDVTGLRAEVAPRRGSSPSEPSARSGGSLGDALALAMRLERLRLSAAQIQLASPVGPWRVEAEGEIRAGEAAPRGELRLQGRSERLRVDATVDAELADGRLSVDIDAREDDGFRIRGQASARAPWDESPMRVTARVAMPSRADLPWVLLPGPRPSGGALHVAGQAQGRLALHEGIDGPSRLVERLIAGDWSGNWRVRGRDLDFAYRFSGMDLQGRGQFASRDGALIVSSDEAPRLRLARIHDALRASLGVPAFARNHADGPVELDWASGELARIAPVDGAAHSIRITSEPDWHVHWPDTRGELHLDARVIAAGGGRTGIDRLAVDDLDVRAADWRAPGIRLTRARVTGDIEGLPAAPSGRLEFNAAAPQLALAGLELQGVGAEASARLEGGDGPTRLTLDDGPGTITVARWRAGNLVRSDDDLRLALTDAEWRLSRPRHWGAAMRVAPFEMDVDVGNRSERVRVEPGPLRAGAHAGVLQLAVVDGAGRIVGRDWVARGVDVTLRPRARADFAAFDVDRLAHAAERPWLAPATMAGRIARNAGGYDLTGGGRVPRAELRFEFDGDYASAPGAASAVLEVPRMRWRPDGRQPQDLLPRLDRLGEVTGAASARVEGRLDRRGVRTEATIRVDDVAMQVAGVRLHGVSGETRLSGLRPLKTQRAQQMRIGRVATAVPVTDIGLQWRIARSRGAGLGVRIIQAEGDLLEGRARVEDARIDTGARLNELDLELLDVSLGGLVDGSGVNGLGARGKLSGRVPLSFGEPGVAVRGARLRGRDGHIALRSRAASKALRQGGRDAELMLSALRDFAYDTLEIDVDAPLGGRGRIDFRLEGRNPEVLGGESLDYEIALTGAVAPLLEAVARGEPLSDARIARHLDLRAAE